LVYSPGTTLLVSLAAALTLALTACGPTQLRPPELPEYDVETQAAIDLQRNADEVLRQFPNAVLPEVERVRFVDLSEHNYAMADCLTAAGFTAVGYWDSFETGAPQGQELPLALATYECQAKYPINPRVMVQLNDDQKRYLYEYYTQIMIPCLKTEGFDAPPAPSLQSYIGTYGQLGSWDPYGLVSVSTNEEWEAINKKCPQDSKELYGL